MVNCEKLYEPRDEDATAAPPDERIALMTPEEFWAADTEDWGCVIIPPDLQATNTNNDNC